jgi:hypothetical protein
MVLLYWIVDGVQGLYTMENQRTLHGHAARMKLTVGQAHRALGHISQTVVLQLAKDGLVNRVNVDLSLSPEFCEACAKAKVSCKPFPDKTKTEHVPMVPLFILICGAQLRLLVLVVPPIISASWLHAECHRTR